MPVYNAFEGNEYRIGPEANPAPRAVESIQAKLGDEGVDEFRLFLEQGAAKAIEAARAAHDSAEVQ